MGNVIKLPTQWSIHEGDIRRETNHHRRNTPLEYRKGIYNRGSAKKLDDFVRRIKKKMNEMEKSVNDSQVPTHSHQVDKCLERHARRARTGEEAIEPKCNCIKTTTNFDERYGQIVGLLANI